MKSLYAFVIGLSIIFSYGTVSAKNKNLYSLAIEITHQAFLANITNGSNMFNDFQSTQAIFANNLNRQSFSIEEKSSVQTFTYSDQQLLLIGKDSRRNQKHKFRPTKTIQYNGQSIEAEKFFKEIYNKVYHKLDVAGKKSRNEALNNSLFIEAVREIHLQLQHQQINSSGNKIKLTYYQNGKQPSYNPGRFTWLNLPLFPLGKKSQIYSEAVDIVNRAFIGSIDVGSNFFNQYKKADYSYPNKKLSLPKLDYSARSIGRHTTTSGDEIIINYEHSEWLQSSPIDEISMPNANITVGKFLRSLYRDVYKSLLNNPKLRNNTEYLDHLFSITLHSMLNSMNEFQKNISQDVIVFEPDATNLSEENIKEKANDSLKLKKSEYVLTKSYGVVSLNNRLDKFLFVGVFSSGALVVFATLGSIPISASYGTNTPTVLAFFGTMIAGSILPFTLYPIMGMVNDSIATNYNQHLRNRFQSLPGGLHSIRQYTKDVLEKLDAIIKVGLLRSRAINIELYKRYASTPSILKNQEAKLIRQELISQIQFEAGHPSCRDFFK